MLFARVVRTVRHRAGVSAVLSAMVYAGSDGGNPDFSIDKKAADQYPKAVPCMGILLSVLPLSFYGKTALAWFLIGAAVVRIKCSLMVFDRYSMLKMTGLYCGSAVLSLLWDHPVIRNISVLLGIVFWLRLSKEIYVRENLRRIFLKLSEWVFIIYVLHEMTLSCVRKLCFRLLPAKPVFWFLEYLLIPIAVMTGCILTGAVFKKVMPGLYRITTGER